MKIGAKGYVLKTMASAQLIYAIEEVLSGKIYLPIALTSRFFEYFQQSFREESSKQEVEEENLLSIHLIEFINDDRLHNLPLHTLYRILNKYSKEKTKRAKQLFV